MCERARKNERELESAKRKGDSVRMSESEQTEEYTRKQEKRERPSVHACACAEERESDTPRWTSMPGNAREKSRPSVPIRVYLPS